MPAPGSKNRKKNFRDVKWLLLSGALVFTLGFWGIFTKLDHKTLASAAPVDPTQTPDNGSETSNTQVLQLPPMPTLIPPADNSVVAASNPAPVIAAPPTVMVSSPVRPKAPVKILLGGSKPHKGGSGGSGAPAPITSTSSSR